MASRADSSLIAPRWHTVLFLAVLLAGPLLAALSALTGHPPPASGTERITGQYLPFLATEWGFVLFVWLGGLRPCGTALASLIGAWPSPRQAVGDLLIALAGWLLITGVALLWPGPHAAAVLPVSVTEKLVWILVACTAAFAEELIFRGYLQRQLAGLSGSVLVGITAQAVLFALVHGEQGLQAAVKIGLDGVLLGVMAHVRGNLRACLLCHAGIDLMSGLFRI